MASLSPTDEDMIWFTAGTAAQGAFNYLYQMKYKPSLAPTVLILGTTIGVGANGVLNESMDRKLAMFLIAFGLSQGISYFAPRVISWMTGAPIQSSGT